MYYKMKNIPRQHNAKPPNAFSGVIFLNSSGEVSCKRSDAPRIK